MENLAENILRIMCAIITLSSIIFLALRFFILANIREVKEELIKLMAHVSFIEKQDIKKIKHRLDKLEVVTFAKYKSKSYHDRD